MTDQYLAVLKATYDYDPQSADEIAIKEDQLLFLVERVDEDWSKVKVKGDSQDAASPIGLVPAAWVEPADHTSVVKALYDYTASAPGELSIAEDEILLVFDTEEQWILVQSTSEGGKAGFVPVTYVEVHEEEEEEPAPAAQIVIPPSPPRPVSTYVDPEDRVAGAKVSADDIKTWAVSEVDKKGKKTKGTLGIGNGAVFFASETSKAAVQKWQSFDISNISIDKSKHVHFDVGGATPASLHFNVGSKDNAEAIRGKLESSKALSQPSAGPASVTPSRSLPPPLAAVAPNTGARRPSVHFSPASPVIIPPRDEDDEDSEPEAAPEQQLQGESATALYDFTADQEDEMSVIAGEKLTVIEKDEEWWKCRNARGKEGVVPASYVEVVGGEVHAAPPDSDSEDEREAAAAAAANAAREEEEAEELARSQAEAEAKRKRKQEEDAAKEKERRKREAAERAKAAASAAEEERKKRKEAAAAAKSASPPPSPARPPSENVKRRPQSDVPDTGRPHPDRVRVWQDRTGQFKTDAAFLGYNNGKLRLHKTNGVIVEVPAEKMSAEDMKYVEKMVSRKSKSARVDDDDVPLAVQQSSRSSNGHPSSSRSAQAQRKPRVDWFEFFLGAGCELDDCTRYAASFERDKIDATILPDITESTMRSLGLREGDIIRVSKAIATRKPKADTSADAQIDSDAALARQLQEAENSGKPAPKLFSTGPDGALKSNGRRTRPAPSKSLPPSVNLNAIGSIADIPRTGSPLASTPAVSSPVQPPPRASSALATSAGGFDDDAWAIKTKPLSPAPPPATNRAPSAPPLSAAVPEPAHAIVASPPPASVAPPVAPPATSTLAKTEDDIFEQLKRLGELRKSVPAPTPPVQSPAVVTTPPMGYHNGLGAGSSPAPMGQFLQPAMTQLTPQPSPVQQNPTYNGPRGPFAPVPSNQGLLQPLIPTQTGFNGFVPSRPTPNTVSPFQNPPNQQPSFLQTQPTGFPMMSQSNGYTPQAQPMMSQPTGFSPQPMISQPTGMPFGGMNGFQGNNGAFGQVQSNPTGYPGMSPFSNSMVSPPPVPPLPSNNTAPANVFAQMKSGTFAAEDNAAQSADKYDALRPNPMVSQATGWGGAYQNSYGGY